MARTTNIKELLNTRLANKYGGWIYCENCCKTIGYLCYVTYDSFKLSYKYKCGGCGNMYIAFEDDTSFDTSTSRLLTVKNRLCCPSDHSPLFTILDKNLKSYQYEVVCHTCNAKYAAKIT